MEIHVKLLVTITKLFSLVFWLSGSYHMMIPYPINEVTGDPINWGEPDREKEINRLVSGQ